MDLINRLRGWLDALTPGERAPKAETEALLVLLADGRPGDRWLAAEALGKRNLGGEGIGALADALSDPDPMLSWEAANALARIGTPPARQVLLDGLRAGSPGVQAVTATALGQVTPDADVWAALVQGLDSSDPSVRQSAAESLARQPFPEALPMLCHLLEDDPKPMVRRAAAVALGRLGDPAARHVLEARWQDAHEDYLVRLAAEQAIVRLRQPEPEEPGEETGEAIGSGEADETQAVA